MNNESKFFQLESQTGQNQKRAFFGGIGDRETAEPSSDLRGLNARLDMSWPMVFHTRNAST